MGSSKLIFASGELHVEKRGVFTPNDGDLGLVLKAIDGRLEDGELQASFTADDMTVVLQSPEWADAPRRAWTAARDALQAKLTNTPPPVTPNDKELLG